MLNMRLPNEQVVQVRNFDLSLLSITRLSNDKVISLANNEEKLTYLNNRSMFTLVGHDFGAKIRSFDQAFHT